MNRLSGSVAIVTLAVVLAGVAGCASSPPTRLYVLAPLQGVGTQTPAMESGKGRTVGLRRVELPDYLDRPQIVTRTGPNTLQLAEFDRWAAPLKESFTRVLAENLVTLLPTNRIAVFPWTRTTPIDYEVSVEVIRFEGTLGAECVLVARWHIFGDAEKVIVSKGSSRRTEPAGSNYESLVATESRLVASLGRDIAAAIEGVTR